MSTLTPAPSSSCSIERSSRRHSPDALRNCAAASVTSAPSRQAGNQRFTDVADAIERRSPTRRPARHARGRAATALRPRPVNRAGKPSANATRMLHSAPPEHYRTPWRRDETGRAESPRRPAPPVRSRSSTRSMTRRSRASRGAGSTWLASRSRTPRPARGGRDTRHAHQVRRVHVSDESRQSSTETISGRPGSFDRFEHGSERAGLPRPVADGAHGSHERYERRGPRLGIRGRNERLEGGATRHRGKSSASAVTAALEASVPRRGMTSRGRTSSIVRGERCRTTERAIPEAVPPSATIPTCRPDTTP